MYNENKRDKELITIYLEKYKINGKHTCFSWSGDKGHPQEVCLFLRTTHFGTRNICGYTNADILHYNDSTLLKPCSGCPIK